MYGIAQRTRITIMRQHTGATANLGLDASPLPRLVYLAARIREGTTNPVGLRKRGVLPGERKQGREGN
eukprot:9467584-Lingulodinium_polyedra.AAC.1